MDDQAAHDRLADALSASLLANGRDLEREMEWLAALIDVRLALHVMRREGSEASRSANRESLADLPAPPTLNPQGSPYARLIDVLKPGPAGRVVLALSLAPLLRPQLLDRLWLKSEETQRGYPEFGGAQATVHGGFLPTGETALFLFAGDSISERLLAARALDRHARLFADDFVKLAAPAPHEPRFAGALAPGQRLNDIVLHGRLLPPEFDEMFPAKRVTSDLSWDDLALPPGTLERLDEIRLWIKHRAAILVDPAIGPRVRPGFTALFSGPPGTGKTLSACLLGKRCDRDVYSIDLSMIVSKYIGETEKNLGRIFDVAESRHWILFFDEADALFGKRTRVDDSHARYANQEVSYLLQRIEAFSGVVVLATNLRSNIDDAFLRRFDAVVEFPMPGVDDRRRLWHAAMPKTVTLDPDVKIDSLAHRHELSGGAIMNVVRQIALRALSRKECIANARDFDEAIRREYLKEGRAP
jgi:hypothetical protein